jgi:glycosyltransferase involved in cell wall biosynthesis
LKKTILFLSANDFKEKSIQVIRKTPEAYIKNGWDVYYIVARDNSKSGNYFYEKEINPKGLKIQRFTMPFIWLKDKISNKHLKTIISKSIGYLTILILAYKGLKTLKKSNIDVVYGYEMHGVLAANIIRFFTFKKKYIYIHRFMGTWLTQYYDKKQYFKLLLNLDHIIALKSSSDLCIMTDDGTQGNRALEIFNSKSLRNFIFLSNGVNEQKISIHEILKFKNQLNLQNEEVFVSISRLTSWKRVDRILHILSKIKYKNYKYFIIGDGDKKEELEYLVKTLNLEENVIFTGAIPNDKVKLYLNISDYFFSMYDLSNVGNPLLEAIRANKIIFTLNNGDTQRWIKHKKNGFIYNINNSLYEDVAKDIDQIIINKDMKKNILKNIKLTEKEMLKDWDERMNIEIKKVENLLNEY